MDTKDNSWSKRHYEQLQEELAKIFPKKETFDLTPIVEKIEVLETYSPDKNRFFCVFSHVDFYPVYLSSNVAEAFGFTAEEICQKGLLWMLKRAYWKQLPMLIKVHHWGKRFQKVIENHSSVINKNAFYCGIKLKDRWKKTHTFFIKQKILIEKNGQPVLSFLEVDNISSIYKSDHIWGRLISVNKQSTICRAFFQGSTKKEYADILRPRELDILKLAIEQKNNTEISELLDISKNTVERHRKNMIARIGVTDMTALIHICQLCQVL